MRATLVFPPHGSPSYTPLGIAYLAGLSRERLDHCQLTVVDVNLTAWERAAQEVAGSPAAFEFFRGRAGDFYDRPSYCRHQETWRAVDARLVRLGAATKRWLGSGTADQGTTAFLDSLAEEILLTDPELVGFSLFSLGQLLWAVALAKRIRQLGSPAPVVLGGAACAAFRPEDVLAACPEILGVVVGEGEAAWTQLCASAPLEAVPGLVYRRGCDVGGNRRSGVQVLDWLPAPDFSGLPLARYLNPTPVLPVLHSRGCKWRRCRFCAHNSSYAGYRISAAGQCADQLDGLARQHGAHHFYFADLYVDAPQVTKLAAELMARRSDYRFHILGRPTPAYTRARLETMASAGCTWISWGVESGSQRLLDEAGKGTRVEEVEGVLEDACGAGISNLMMLIFGLPTSTDHDAALTHAFIERVYGHVDAMTASPFALFEHTPFARGADRYGLEILGPEVEFTVAAVPVRNRRLLFRERTGDGSSRPPRGPVEAGLWQRRRRWLGEVPFLEGIACEHYLLHVSHPPTRTLRPPLEPGRKVA